MRRTLVALLLASPAAAQVTHDVSVTMLDFEPADIQIAVGDTVRWTWVEGFHNVTSGKEGIPDGIFMSPTGFNLVYSVTFDQAFVDANPVPGGRYDYFCTIHVSQGQFGSVTIDLPSSTSTYGCLNPAGSLVELSGAPVIGGTWTLGVENPLGTQPAGSLAFLGVSANPQIGFPCGLSLPGFGMSAPGAAGEILIGISAPDPLVTFGPQSWAGTGSPSAFPVTFPTTPTFAGVTLYFQGMIYDVAGTSGITLGLTEGIAATVGNV